MKNFIIKLLRDKKNLALEINKIVDVRNIFNPTPD